RIGINPRINGISRSAPSLNKNRTVLASGADREIPLILGLMPILPKHATDADAFAKTTLKPMIGSGPYVIDKVDAPQSITFKRNPDYWARNLPIRRGLFNVDEIKIDYYRDATTLFEAFKTGAVDVRFENDPVRWAEGYDFRAARDGKVVRETAATGLPAGMNALVFNTRKPLFKDQSVRRALNLLFDFQWINKSLYNGQFARTESFFARSKLSANATAASEQERAWLAAHAARVKPAVMDGAAKQPVGAGTGQDRKRFRDAIALFKDAGWTIKSGKLVNADSGAPFRFEFLARSKEQERLMLSFKGTLQRLGIGVDIRQVDNSQYWTRLKTFDFDMIMWRWSASLSPAMSKSPDGRRSMLTSMAASTSLASRTKASMRSSARCLPHAIATNSATPSARSIVC
ncbi:MAG: ABC transporter substrate-binding protein, partial [Pseudomonadota bacterium]